MFSSQGGGEHSWRHLCPTFSCAPSFPPSSAGLSPQWAEHPFPPITRGFCFFCCLKTGCQQYIWVFLSAGDSGHPNQPGDQRPPTLLCHHRHGYQTGMCVSVERGGCSLGHVVEQMMSVYLNVLRSCQNRLVGLANPLGDQTRVLLLFMRGSVLGCDYWCLSCFGNVKHLCVLLQASRQGQ